MSSVLTVQAGFVSPPIPVNQYSVVQVAPNASPGSVSVLYSQDPETYIRAGTASWTAWPNGSVTSSSAMMSNAKMFLQVSAQSSAATVSIGDPTPGQQEIVQSPWSGAEVGAMIFSSTVTFQAQILSAASTVAAPGYSFFGDTGTGFYRQGAGAISMASAGSEGFRFTGAGSAFSLVSDSALLRFGISVDAIIARDAADVLAMRRGANAQTLRIYGSFAASSSFASLSHNGTNAVMSTNSGGLALSASTMSFFGVGVTTRPNVSSAVTTTAGTSVGPFGFVTAQQFQDTVNAVNAIQNALKQLGLSA